MAATTPAVAPLKAGVGCACPRCGRGKLFDGYLTVVDQCAVCGLPLRRNDTGDGPAVFLVIVLGILAVPIAFWIDAAFAAPDWVPAFVAGLLVIVLAFGLLRPAKAYLLALQFRHRRSDFEAGA